MNGDQFFEEALKKAAQAHVAQQLKTSAPKAQPQRRSPLEELRLKCSEAQQRNKNLRQLGLQLQVAFPQWEKVSMQEVNTGDTNNSPQDVVPGYPEEHDLTLEALEGSESPDTTPNENPPIYRLDVDAGGGPPSFDPGNRSTVEAPAGGTIRKRLGESSTDMSSSTALQDMVDGGAKTSNPAGAVGKAAKRANLGAFRSQQQGQQASYDNKHTAGFADYRSIPSVKAEYAAQTAMSPAGGSNSARQATQQMLRTTPAKRSSAQLLQKISGGKRPDDVRQAHAYIQRTMNLHSPDDVLYVLKKSAQARGKDLPSFLDGLRLGEPGRANQWKLDLLTQIKISEGLMGEALEERARTEVDTAKDVVEAAVRAQGELPTTTQVAQAAGVSPTAANVAIFEVAELVASTGGQLAAPGQAAMAPAPMPPGMAPPMVPPMAPPMPGSAPMSPMPMGMAPPGMAPPGMAPPGMAPPMPPGGGMPPAGGMPPDPMAAPVDPSMQVQSSIHPVRLRQMLLQLAKRSSSEMGGVPQGPFTDTPVSQVVEAGDGIDAQQDNGEDIDTSDMLTSEEDAMVNDILSGQSGPQDTDETLEDTTHTDMMPSGATSHGTFDTRGEQVAGTDPVDGSQSGLVTSGSRRGGKKGSGAKVRGEDLLSKLLDSLTSWTKQSQDGAPPWADGEEEEEDASSDEESDEQDPSSEGSQEDDNEEEDEEGNS